MSMHQERKRIRCQIQAHNGSDASSSDRTGSSCQNDSISQGGKTLTYSEPDLSLDIWHHILSLLPMQDAAHAACVSRTFLCSWRYHPKFTFAEETMCLNKNAHRQSLNKRRYYNNKVDQVLRNHSGIGIKTLDLRFDGPYNTKSYNRLDSWLQIAVTSGIEKLTLTSLSYKSKYNFPCSLLSGRSGDSIRQLELVNCALRPTSAELGLRSLTTLHLNNVRITGHELGCVLSNCFVLEQLVLRYCDDIIRLEIPCLLLRLSHLHVAECLGLQVIDNKAPNITSFQFLGGRVQLSLEAGEWLQVKNLTLYYPCVISYAVDKLPSSTPNLERLIIHSPFEMVDAPMAPTKFLHLKFLSISLRERKIHRDYDYRSLVSFLDASPSMETFVLFASEEKPNCDLIVGDPLSLRQMPGCLHDKLKNVRIIGFRPQKSLVGLTRHILEKATSLQCLTLDTTTVAYRCSGNIYDRKCPPLGRDGIMKAHRAMFAVRTYIEGNVPSTVKLDVLELCSRCHTVEL